MEENRMIIGEQESGERLDKVIALNKKWSRVRIQDWIREGLIKVNEREQKANYRVIPGDEIVIHVPPLRKVEIYAEKISLDIRFEDSDMLVINKPRGMVVHPGAGNHSGTLVNALLGYCGDDLSGIGGVARPGIVHRIDKDTSGLLMVAKNDLAHESLSEQLQNHSVKRIYLAVVHNLISHERGTINAPIGRDPHNRQRMAVIDRGGKKAITHFKVKERLTDSTLVECQLETGRTHQIRVHMKYIGFPLVGDALYAPRRQKYDFSGQALHARSLGFNHPRSGEWINIEAEIPQDMDELLKQLRN